MDKKDRHREKKEKEREQKNKNEQKYENAAQKRRLPVPVWAMLLGIVLCSLALYVWMLLPPEN
jgi:type VI protein secretion system component VasF